MTTLCGGRRNSAGLICLVYLAILAVTGASGSRREFAQQPNILLLLADDMGFGDLESFGHPYQETTPIDRMAEEGMRMLSMYAADSVCTPSRAALMTGRLPSRLGLFAWDEKHKNEKNFGPSHLSGLPLEEVTMAETLKDAGYTTGMVGKWHLGINKDEEGDGYWLPSRQGFDFVGHNLPFGNTWTCDENFVHMTDGPTPNRCFLYYGDELIQQPYEHSNLTQKFVADAKYFIENSGEDPFFFYFAFAHVHVSLFANEEHRGKSVRGDYGDNVLELGWAVGEMLDFLKERGLADNTLVVFSSDNGPHVELCTEGGDTGIFSGGKGSFMEGGLRVPTVVWWPGVIEPGSVSYETASLMDLMVTFTDIGGGELASDTLYDGRSLRGVLFDEEQSPHEYLFFYFIDYLFAVVHNQYKVVFRSYEPPTIATISGNCSEGFPIYDYTYGLPSEFITHDTPLVFNLYRDPREMYPLAPDVYGDVMDNVMAALVEFNKTFEVGLAILGGNCIDCQLVPCCNKTSDDCACNYPGTSFTSMRC